MQNVALFPIFVVKQGDPRIAVRIVFNSCYFRGDIPLIAAKVNNSVKAFVPTTAPTAGNHATVVAAFLPVYVYRERFLWFALGDFGEVRDGTLAGTGVYGRKERVPIILSPESKVL
jgi:hypothetical protein